MKENVLKYILLNYCGGLISRYFTVSRCLLCLIFRARNPRIVMRDKIFVNFSFRFACTGWQFETRRM